MVVSTRTGDGSRPIGLQRWQHLVDVGIIVLDRLPRCKDCQKVFLADRPQDQAVTIAADADPVAGSLPHEAAKAADRPLPVLATLWQRRPVAVL